MSQRRKNPALYELLGSRPINKPGSSHTPVSDPLVEEEDSAFGIKPGRTIRVPMGYLFFAIAGVIALIFGGYMLGYQQRDRLAEKERLRMLTNDAGPNGENTIADPLVSNATNHSGNPSNLTNSDSSGSQTQQPRNTGGGASTGSPLPNVWFVRNGVQDPRQPGLNYFILATNYPWDEAEKAALYLGRNGVGAVVYPSTRSNRWNLSTRQGFEGGTYRDAEAQALVERIKSIGERYQDVERGATDFDDLYPARLD
ncbi:MAG: hypothetical protein ACIAQF_13840 [Phycisphaerales bacterium JB065]